MFFIVISSKIKKIINILQIIFVLIVLFIISLNLLLWNKTNEKITFLNKYGIATVLSGSMEPQISKNDLIIIKKINNYNINDIIVYKRANTLIVHRIVDINDDKIITKGDANDEYDKPIKVDQIYGKVSYKIPFIGNLTSFFKTRQGFVFVIILIICLFIYSCINEVKKMKEK